MQFNMNSEQKLLRMKVWLGDLEEMSQFNYLGSFVSADRKKYERGIKRSQESWNGWLDCGGTERFSLVGRWEYRKA